MDHVGGLGRLLPQAQEPLFLLLVPGLELSVSLAALRLLPHGRQHLGRRVGRDVQLARLGLVRRRLRQLPEALAVDQPDQHRGALRREPELAALQGLRDDLLALLGRQLLEDLRARLALEQRQVVVAAVDEARARPEHGEHRPPDRAGDARAHRQGPHVDDDDLVDVVWDVLVLHEPVGPPRRRQEGLGVVDPGEVDILGQLRLAVEGPRRVQAVEGKGRERPREVQRAVDGDGEPQLLHVLEALRVVQRLVVHQLRVLQLLQRPRHHLRVVHLGAALALVPQHPLERLPQRRVGPVLEAVRVQLELHLGRLSVPRVVLALAVVRDRVALEQELLLQLRVHDAQEDRGARHPRLLHAQRRGELRLGVLQQRDAHEERHLERALLQDVVLVVHRRRLARHRVDEHRERGVAHDLELLRLRLERLQPQQEEHQRVHPRRGLDRGAEVVLREERAEVEHRPALELLAHLLARGVVEGAHDLGDGDVVRQEARPVDP